MPFSLTADGVFDNFKSAIQHYGFVAIQACGVASAQAVTYPGWVVSTDGTDRPFNPVITKLLLVDTSQNNLICETVTRPELRNFFDFVQNNTDNNYRNVKNNQFWRDLYGVRPKEFSTYNSKTNLKGSEMHDATYCQKCGVILPLRNLTIDHQKPQKGGEAQAMMRVFRAAGLTVATGSGQKNRFLQGRIAPLVGGNTTVLARGERGSDPDRYTLSIKGVIYFTALVQYNLVDQMLQMSMHHIVNLRPMCGPCNSATGNRNLTWL